MCVCVCVLLIDESYRELLVAQGGSLLLEWNNCIHGCLPCLIDIYTHMHTLPQCKHHPQKEHHLLAPMSLCHIAQLLNHTKRVTQL